MTASEHPSGLLVRTADLSRAKPPRWAWENRIPIAYLSLLLGREGTGKGVLLAWAISRWTRGELPGDLDGEPIAVGIIGDEDGFDDVWAPRLHAAGADLGLVKQIERPDGGYIELGADREKLAVVIEAEGIKVVYVDELLDNLGTRTDDWKSKSVRQALRPLQVLARESDIAVLSTLHPNKRGSSFRELVGGTVAFNAVTRSGLLLAEHPDEPGSRVLIRAKGNLSVQPKAIEFTIESHGFIANGDIFDVPKATSFGESDLTIDDLLAASPGGGSAERTQIAEAVELIEAMLPGDGEWHAAKPIYEAAKAEGLETHTVGRARKKLGLEYRREHTFQAGAEWRWPTTEAADDARSPVDVASRSVESVTSKEAYTHDTHNTLTTTPPRESTASSAPIDAARAPELFDSDQDTAPPSESAEHPLVGPAVERVRGKNRGRV